MQISPGEGPWDLAVRFAACAGPWAFHPTIPFVLGLGIDEATDLRVHARALRTGCARAARAWAEGNLGFVTTPFGYH